jgi:hypothetical protein
MGFLPFAEDPARNNIAFTGPTASAIANAAIAAAVKSVHRLGRTFEPQQSAEQQVCQKGPRRKTPRGRMIRMRTNYRISGPYALLPAVLWLLKSPFSARRRAAEFALFHMPDAVRFAAIGAASHSVRAKPPRLYRGAFGRRQLARTSAERDPDGNVREFPWRLLRDEGCQQRRTDCVASWLVGAEETIAYVASDEATMFVTASECRPDKITRCSKCFLPRTKTRRSLNKRMIREVSRNQDA